MKLWITLLWCTLCTTPTLYSQTATTWDVVKDVQISFTQGANGVWFFMESESRVQDPSKYRLLPRYLAPCRSSATQDVLPGVGCWQGSEAHPPGVCCALKTEVTFNFTDKLLDSQDTFPGYLPHSLLITATWERLAIVAWRSPITGVVKVAGAFGWRNLRATEANWFLEKGKDILRSGLLFGGQPEGSLSVPEVAVTKGDVLYFIVNDFNFEECFCANPVDFHAKITQLR
jgi:hypothetical protein